MADDKKVLVDVIVNATQSIKDIIKLTGEVDSLKKAQKGLDRTTQEGAEAYETYAAQIRVLNAEIRKKRSETDKSIAQANQEKGSLDSLSISLSKAKAEYRALSEQDRNSAKGMMMRDSILATNTALKVAEEAYGDYYRSVGQYDKINEAVRSEIDKLNNDLKGLADQFLKLSEEEKQSEFGKNLIAQMNGISESINQTRESYDDFAKTQEQYNQNILSAISGNNELVSSLLQTATSGEGAKGVIKQLGVQLSAFGKSLLALLANPVVLTIAAIVGVLYLLSKAFQRNEENTTTLGAATAKLGGIFNWLLKVLEPVAAFLVDGIIKYYEMVGEAIDYALGKIANAMEFLGMESAAKFIRETTTEIKGMIAASSQLAEAEAELTKAQREARRVQLDYQRDAEKLRQIRDDESKSISERIKANDELGKVLKQQLQTELSIAQKALEVANLRLQIEGSTADNLDAQATALTTIADIQERITGQESEQLRNLNSLRKEAADKAFESMMKTLENKKALDEAMIKAESDFQSEDFNKRQAYEKRLFDLSQESEKQKLSLQRKYGKITQKEYDAQLAILSNQQTEFANTQIKGMNDYYLSQRRELLDMIEKDTDLQIQEVNEKFAKAVKDLGELQEPVKLIGQSDEDFAKEMRKYEIFMFDRAQLQLQLEKQRIKEIEDINEASLQKRLSDIEKAVEKEYRDDLAKFSDNERAKTEVEIKAVKDTIERKKAANLSVYDDEAKLRSLNSQLNQIALNTELLKANENAQAKYEARKAYLLKERELYKDNADKQLEINAELKANDKELLDSRIAAFEEWSSKTTELMSAISGLSSANDQAELQRYEEDNERKKEVLEQRLQSGQISQKEYDAQIKESDKELENQKAAIARKQAIREKALKVFEIGVNTASGIMKAVSASPLTFGLPWSAFVGATGAVQLAAVLSQPLPKASKGLLLNGPSHARGGIPIEAEGGEAIINKRSTSMFAPLLSAINVAGGGVPFVSPMSDGGFSFRVNEGSKGNGITKREMQQVIKDFKVYTTVEDYRRADNNYTIVQNRAFI